MTVASLSVQNRSKKQSHNRKDDAQFTQDVLQEDASQISLFVRYFKKTKAQKKLSGVKVFSDFIYFVKCIYQLFHR